MGTAVTWNDGKSEVTVSICGCDEISEALSIELGVELILEEHAHRNSEGIIKQKRFMTNGISIDIAYTLACKVFE